MEDQQVPPVDAATERFGDFLNVPYGIIGRTASTKSEPNTSTEFHFWVAARDEATRHIEIGNIVTAVSDDGSDATFGVVTEMRSYSDVDSFLADFLSHNFGEAGIVVPTDVAEVIVVTCRVVRNLSNTSRPVGRSRVHFPSALGIQFAYGLVNREGQSIFTGAPIPIGVFENGDGTTASISVDEDFLIGPEGAHLNVSGISGLASKTSAVQFVLRSLLHHSQRRVAVAMFNVKSRDLLYSDVANPRAAGDAWSAAAYQALQVPPTPFANARFFAPQDPRDPDAARTLRQLPTERFRWNLQMIYRDIPSLFHDQDWDDKMEGVWFTIQEEIEAGRLVTYSQMQSWVQQEIANANQRNQIAIRSGHVLTWTKMFSHLRRFPRAFGGLIASDAGGQDIPWGKLDSGSVFVVDIQDLDDRGKRLVFGRAMRSMAEELEGETDRLDAIVVFVDELNKFAPAGNVRTPLKSRLVDITARGRSIGLVLFGAEQFASDVEKEIIENCCLHRPKLASDSDPIRTPVPIESGQ